MIETERSIERAIADGSAAIARTGTDDDPLFPVAVLRGRRDVGLDVDAGDLLSRWAPGVTRETGAIRYRWGIYPRFPGITPRFTGSFPEWIGPIESWQPWRTADATAWAERAARPLEDIERLLTPIILTDSLDLLSDIARRSGASGDLARAFLDEALPKVRRDAAGWVQELRAWADTWALWAMARRPGALTLLYPFAAAIAGSYATSARKAGGGCSGHASRSMTCRSSRVVPNSRPGWSRSESIPTSPAS